MNRSVSGNRSTNARDRRRRPVVVVGEDGVDGGDDRQRPAVAAVVDVEAERSHELQRPGHDVPVARRRPHHRREHAVVEPVAAVLPAAARWSGPRARAGRRAPARRTRSGRRPASGRPGGTAARSAWRPPASTRGAQAGGVLGPAGEHQQVPAEAQDGLGDHRREALDADIVEHGRTPLDVADEVGADGLDHRARAPAASRSWSSPGRCAASSTRPRAAAASPLVWASTSRNPSAVCSPTSSPPARNVVERRRPRARRPRDRGRPGRAASRRRAGAARGAGGGAPARHRSQAAAVSTGRAESVLRTRARDAAHSDVGVAEAGGQRAGADVRAGGEEVLGGRPARSPGPRPRARSSVSVPCHRSWALIRPSPVWATIGTARDEARRRRPDRRTARPGSSASAVPIVASASRARRSAGSSRLTTSSHTNCPHRTRSRRAGPGDPMARRTRAGQPPRPSRPASVAARPTAGDGGDLVTGEGQGLLGDRRGPARRRAAGPAAAPASVARPARGGRGPGAPGPRRRAAWTADEPRRAARGRRR